MPRRTILLTLAACGAVLPAVAGCDAATEPEEDRLLTDAELYAGPSASVSVPSAWDEWVRDQHEPIRSLTVDHDFSDLEFLRGYVGDRRVVQLGESAHGAAEFSRLKVRLVKYLHERLGFDVIALEGAVYECFMTNLLATTEHPGELMWRCVPAFWRTAEVLALFEYVKATHATGRPLKVAGFDSQITAARGVGTRPVFLRDAVATFNSAYAGTVAHLDSVFLGGELEADPAQFGPQYEALADSLEVHRETLVAAYPTEPWRAVLAWQTARSSARLVEQAGAGFAGGIAVRDAAMADNLDVILDALFPGDRVITWAHNYHVAAGLGQSTNRGEPLGVVTMGVMAEERHPGELYTIGVYMLRGSASSSLGGHYDIAEPTNVGVEQILARAGRKYVFVDLASRSNGAGTSWMFEASIARSWGEFDVRLVPYQHYDAIVLVHTVSPARFWPNDPP
jgi:erythromycin esterase